MFLVSRIKYKRGQNGIIQNVLAMQSTAAANQTASVKSPSEAERIVVPKKINRRPTDILYTLSKTVGKDPTAAHYKYHDDPFLMPTSVFFREQYALSKEAGKLTAKWIKQQHADLYNAKEAQPIVEAFLPKPLFTEESSVELKNLEDAVESFNVTDAILIYRLLIAQKVTVPDNVQQNLLELVCFYNHNNPLAFDMFEERNTKEMAKRSRDSTPEAWPENSFADELFNSMEPRTAAAYNTMIRALFKYRSHDRAEQLFNEATEKGIAIDLATYNLLIRNIGKPGLTAEMRWDKVKTTLGEIHKQQLTPNVHTLNAILSTIKLGGNIASIQEYASQTIAEFQRLNIEPSLTTYSHLLDIYHGKQSPPCNVIHQIVDRLEKSPDLTAQSVDDLQFFYKAMVVCRHRLTNSASIAQRIDDIVSHSDNVKFLGDSQLEQAYYRNLLTTILNNESLVEFIRMYDQLVPETYSLEPSVVDEIFSKINISGEIQYIPKFWTDMVISGVSKRSQINDVLLTLMVTNQPDADIRAHEGLVNQFAEIGWSIYQNILNDQLTAARKEQVIPALRLSNIIILLLRAGEHASARSIVETCLEQQRENRIVGCITDAAILHFIDSCVVNKEPNIAIRCVTYSIENGVGDPLQYGRKIIESFTLSSNDVKRITDLVGQDVLKAVQKPSQ